jgi:DNA-directed RNA polymerase specialized sigma24 family protein
MRVGRALGWTLAIGSWRVLVGCVGPSPVVGEEQSELGDGDVPPALEQGQRRALLRTALDALPLEQRAVFTLFELEGLAGHEIASMIGVPLPTVHSRLRLAREAFRRALARAVARDEFYLRRNGVIV